ncbi:hypothetical protein Q5P01_010177 [Channa striata]|uniref:Uncharacterized protein n=1 Tax=Channa striata TaxID=64152 RepID=A0AA88SQ98_CHASR|nr:hypothetical protein Q5P01_010177 [Channa striata]
MRYEKQAASSSSGGGGGAATIRAQFTSTSQDQSSERKFHALPGRVSVGDGGGNSRTKTVGCSVDLAGDWSAGSPFLLSLESASWGTDSCFSLPFTLSLCLDKTDHLPLEYAAHPCSYCLDQYSSPPD